MKLRDPREVAEQTARVSYGRLLALLISRSRDIAASEDALSEAFVCALRTWPVDGVPGNPDAWLLTAARNNLKNLIRHQMVIDASAVDLALLQDEAVPEAPSLADDRHPCIPRWRCWMVAVVRIAKAGSPKRGTVCGGRALARKGMWCWLALALEGSRKSAPSGLSNAH